MITIPDGATIAGIYRVEARLGGGAFGTVYRVRHPFLGIQALKLLPYETEDDLKRLAREGATHAQLTHPNITRIFDVNITDIGGESALFIASEYMPLGDLDSYLGQAVRLSLNDFKTLADGMLAALVYAHGLESPIVHRDLKPANIVVGGQDVLIFKVADFGVSAELESREQRITGVAGTRAFQAPECAFGSYLIESDLYSVALILYRALTGIYPFPIHRLSRGEAPKPSQFRLEINAELDAVLLKGVAHSPFERYRSASSFRCALLEAIESLRPSDASA